MSLADYEDFVFRACHVLDDDPVEHWRQVGERLQARAEELGSVRELRIVGEDTDLTVVVEGRTWRAAYGRQNVPDGEVYTSPIETGVNGTIRFGFPAVFVGREIDDARLVLENGRVVAAEAAGGEEYLRSLLRPRETQPYVGEEVSRRRGDGIEYADIRQFAFGDMVTRINWRATARRGELWVNDRHPERNTEDRKSVV